MRFNVLDKASKAAAMLFLALTLIASSASASSPRAEGPPSPCAPEQAAELREMALVWVDQAEVRHVRLEIERARMFSERLSLKAKRIFEAERYTAHPVNPALQALISIAKVPARALSPVAQAFSGVAKALCHVLQALLA